MMQQQSSLFSPAKAEPLPGLTELLDSSAESGANAKSAAAIANMRPRRRKKPPLAPQAGLLDDAASVAQPSLTINLPAESAPRPAADPIMQPTEAKPPEIKKPLTTREWFKESQASEWRKEGATEEEIAARHKRQDDEFAEQEAKKLPDEQVDAALEYYDFLGMATNPRVHKYLLDKDKADEYINPEALARRDRLMDFVAAAVANNKKGGDKKDPTAQLIKAMQPAAKDARKADLPMSDKTAVVEDVMRDRKLTPEENRLMDDANEMNLLPEVIEEAVREWVHAGKATSDLPILSDDEEKAISRSRIRREVYEMAEEGMPVEVIANALRGTKYTTSSVEGMVRVREDYERGLEAYKQGLIDSPYKLMQFVEAKTDEEKREFLAGNPKKLNNTAPYIAKWYEEYQVIAPNLQNDIGADNDEVRTKDNYERFINLTKQGLSKREIQAQTGWTNAEYRTLAEGAKLRRLVPSGDVTPVQRARIRTMLSEVDEKGKPRWTQWEIANAAGTSRQAILDEKKAYPENMQADKARVRLDETGDVLLAAGDLGVEPTEFLELLMQGVGGVGNIYQHVMDNRDMMIAQLIHRFDNRGPYGRYVRELIAEEVRHKKANPELTAILVNEFRKALNRRKLATHRPEQFLPPPDLYPERETDRQPLLPPKEWLDAKAEHEKGWTAREDELEQERLAIERLKEELALARQANARQANARPMGASKAGSLR